MLEGAYLRFDRPAGYDVDWQLQALRELRKARIAELTRIAKTFPKDVKVLIHVVHGGTERKILAAAEQHVSKSTGYGKRWTKRLTLTFGIACSTPTSSFWDDESLDASRNS